MVPGSFAPLPWAVAALIRHDMGAVGRELDAAPSSSSTHARVVAASHVTCLWSRQVLDDGWEVSIGVRIVCAPE